MKKKTPKKLKIVTETHKKKKILEVRVQSELANAQIPRFDLQLCHQTPAEASAAVLFIHENSLDFADRPAIDFFQRGATRDTPGRNFARDKKNPIRRFKFLGTRGRRLAIRIIPTIFIKIFISNFNFSKLRKLFSKLCFCLLRFYAFLLDVLAFLCSSICCFDLEFGTHV